MMTFIEGKLQKITWKHWLLFLFLSQSLFIIMHLVTIPQIYIESGNLNMFDLSPLGYSYDYAYQFLSNLSEKGYKVYLSNQLPLDLFFPFFNFLFGMSSFVLLYRIYAKATNHKDKQRPSVFYKVILLLPFTAMVFDYLENLMVFIMLSYKAQVPKTTVAFANVFTLIKSLSTSVFYTLCLILFVIILLKWLLRKKVA